MTPTTKTAIVDYRLAHPKAKAVDVAKHFNVPVNSINYLRSASGVAKVRKEFSETALRKFVEKNKCATVKQIAEHFGVCQITMSKRLMALGLDMETRLKESEAGIVALAEEKPWMSCCDITQTFGVMNPTPKGGGLGKGLTLATRASND